MSFVFVIWHKYQKYQSVELGDQLISRLLDCFFPGRLYILRAVNGFAAPRQLAGARLSRVQLGPGINFDPPAQNPLCPKITGDRPRFARGFTISQKRINICSRFSPLIMPEQTLKLAVPLTAGCLTFQVTIIISRKRTSPIEVES